MAGWLLLVTLTCAGCWEVVPYQPGVERPGTATEGAAAPDSGTAAPAPASGKPVAEPTASDLFG